jgi:solute carrier family 25 S-adenosylmethionine transporter 26
MNSCSSIPAQILFVLLITLLLVRGESRKWAPLSAGNRAILVSHHEHQQHKATRSTAKAISITNTTKPQNSQPSVAQVVSLTISQRLIAGGFSRGIGQMILYPVDALRTLAQTRDGRTLADVGVNALVRGCTTTSSFAILIGSIQYAIFGATRDSCGPVLSSALGGAGSCLVSVPQEVIKQRLVTGVYSNFGNAVATIYKTEGIQGFYSAWRPTLSSNIPFVTVTFTMMDFLKRSRLKSKRKYFDNNKASHEQSDQSLSLNVLENLVIGISSSLIGVTITHPADVIKTRMMTQAASTALPYTSTMDCIQTIWKTEGVKSFYSGISQRSIYMGPLWAIQFALNGKFSTAFKNQGLKRKEIELSPR